jgi:DNA sulfur modification protein DndD
MLLKSIKLKNFRQFKDAYLEFATGTDGRNVTIIKGENGTGKTTFEQAFFWCLYGKTDFTDKVLLNKDIIKEMRPSKDEEVEVELQLWQGDVEYHLIRNQKYHIDYNGKVYSDNPNFDIAMYKDKSPNPQFVEQTQLDYVVKSILNQQLSKYFFFDGEHIEKMSKEVTSGKKSDEFAGAVQDLLGLNAIKNALDHLSPTKASSVIRSYDKSFNGKSDERIEELTEEINEKTDKINNIANRISDLETERSNAQTLKDEKIKELTKYEEGKQLQEKRKGLENSIDQCNTIKTMKIKDVCRKFEDGLPSMLSSSLIERAMKVVEGKDILSKDIPYMRIETIEYLLKKGKCICGTDLKEGTYAYNAVKELENYVLPKSISTSVGDFKREALKRLNNNTNLYEDIKADMSEIRDQDDQIQKYTDDLKALESQFDEKELNDKLHQINGIIRDCRRTIEDDTKEIEKLQEEKGTLNSELLRASTSRQKLSLLDDHNRQIEICRAYALRVYDDLKKNYDEEEKRVRDQLEMTMNDIFEKLYNGQLSLKIDERYHISVVVNSYEGDVETSEGQSISVIFAFIAAIIKMARENQCREQGDKSLLYSEPYPLVMDAPLSAFDKRRIKNVCETLPQIAEQVVIFIKDTDGDIAEENMGNKIGMKYTLHMDELNPFETTVEKDGAYNV